MPARGKRDPLAGLIARFERLERALDEALTGADFRRVRRKRKRAAPRPADSAQAIKRAAATVLTTLHASLLAAPDARGALTYYQLKARCKLDDDLLGLALNELIPSHLRTRSDGDERRYFLRRDLRRAALAKRQRLRPAA